MMLIWPLLQEHEANERFNPGWLEDESEHIVLETVGSVITPLCRQRGRIVLTPLRLYFQPFNVVSDAPLQVSSLAKVRPSGLLCLENLGHSQLHHPRANALLATLHERESMTYHMSPACVALSVPCSTLWGPAGGFAGSPHLPAAGQWAGDLLLGEGQPVPHAAHVQGAQHAAAGPAGAACPAPAASAASREVAQGLVQGQGGPYTWLSLVMLSSV